MGCNESKQAVATSNTISRRAFRKKLSIKPKDLETIPENIVHIVTTNSAVQQQQQREVESNKCNDDDNAAGKDESLNNTDLKADEQPPEVVNEKVDEDAVINAEGDDQELGKSITSPDHYFSSRKDEDATESVGTNDEGYFSPNHDSVKDLKDDIELKEETNDDTVKENSLANEQETSLFEEEEKKENAEDSKKPNMVKVDQVKTVEAYAEVPEVTKIEEKENPILSQDSPRALSTQDIKTS